MSRELFKSNISYNPETGVFTWLVSKKGHRKAGDIAGSRHSRGYVSIRIGGKDYLAHRLAMIMSGYDLQPNDQVDHINGNRSDNRLCNLRIATHTQNCHNSAGRKNSRSGLKGAHFHKRRNLYRARITVNGKTHWLGYFSTPEEAHAAYCEAAEKLHGPFYREVLTPPGSE